MERSLSIDSGTLPGNGRLPSAGAKLRRSTSAMPKQGAASLRPLTASRPRRPYSAYTTRGPEEQTPKYDNPESNREWWRGYLKETPIPGAYSHKGFVEELGSQANTYGFRNIGRRPTSGRFRSSGELLLPGAYDHSDFITALNNQSATYNFQSTERDYGPKIGHGYGDKDLETDPTRHDLRMNDITRQERERNMKDARFKSSVKRKIEANHQFRVVDKGPGPGLYEEGGSHRPKSATINSVFVSKVQRFQDKGPGVPGPGTYNISTSAFGKPRPLPAISHHMKKKAGIPVT